MNYFDYINSIRFELSRKCPNSTLHKDICPNYLGKSDEILSSEIVFKVVNELRQSDNKHAEIGFHNYNEPTIDPRLVWFVTMIRLGIENPIAIWSNGYYLDYEIIMDLISQGANRFNITAYNEEDYNKFSELKKKIPFPADIMFNVVKANFDARLGVYEQEIINLNKPCFAPLCQLLINYKGEVSLCSYDWKYTVIFGNLYKENLADIFPRMKEAFDNLKTGKRIYDICQRCKRSKTGTGLAIPEVAMQHLNKIANKEKLYIKIPMEEYEQQIKKVSVSGEGMGRELSSESRNDKPDTENNTPTE